MNNFADNEFIHRVVNQYSDMIIRIAFQHTKNRADAEDIMQDVFLALLKQQAFDTEEHLKAWLIRVTINKSRDYLKSAKKRASIEFNTADNSLTEGQSIIFDEIQKLNEHDRNIIYLFYYEGYTAKEIGALIGKKEKAVLMRLSRAREKLKHLLEVENEK